MKYNIVFEELAENDLTDIFEYICNKLHEPEIAVRIYRSLKKDILSLETMPFRFALLEENPYKSMGVRCIAIENYTAFHFPFNFITTGAFYIPDKSTKTVHILRILYNRRDWKAIL